MTKYNCLSDLQLWDLLKSGDRLAYAELYERYFSVLYVHARNRLKNSQEAEDVIQEIFLDIWTNCSKICIRTSLINYLITATKNRVLNLIARHNFEGKYKVTLALDEKFEAITDHLVREKMLSKLIDHEIDALPPKMRKVFLMSRADHLTYNEIADHLDITEQSVRSHVKNALKVLRVKLGVLIFITIFFF
ncbi:RNA polymerase sigma-70 factor (family 1) [Pedobacter psychrotolerans]|uniref:DNA-directed RNA polymerase sigma-70 factor n=1 Tax=Pedobacter psychrotolerans TaxID=1843235 RepID=A0A4R2HIN1_9SPHI|nr:RNA polymerase sigma-70 factor [Pedobacter psychrotolerans]TCO28857.1 RNA polymerase sigma-70 factor (family 1) [Pedobacter psychrotolerans]GGE52331.1 DNA-directed RNA polymerase sigma-70 factor [Pedobacter psychrotolerans]